MFSRGCTIGNISDQHKEPKVLIITGPTASGKTALSEQIARQNRFVELVNVDVGQFYAQLSIGTAKPNLQLDIYKKSHCFNILHEPQEFNVIEYRKTIITLVDDIVKRNGIPLIVGGSLFYISSLFFPPQEHKKLPESEQALKKALIPDNDNTCWDFLYSIDPVRAKALYRNDIYRIKRALDLWVMTGNLPSTCAPVFNPPFRALCIGIIPERFILRERIDTRVIQMINTGWIDEVRALWQTPWECFIRQKGLIGYEQLFDWLAAGEKQEALPIVIKKIQTLTVQYAKRQVTFWHGLAKRIKKGEQDQSRVLTQCETFNNHKDLRIENACQGFLCE